MEIYFFLLLQRSRVVSSRIYILYYQERKSNTLQYQAAPPQQKRDVCRGGRWNKGENDPIQTKGKHLDLLCRALEYDHSFIRRSQPVFCPKTKIKHVTQLIWTLDRNQKPAHNITNQPTTLHYICRSIWKKNNLGSKKKLYKSLISIIIPSIIRFPCV